LEVKFRRNENIRTFQVVNLNNICPEVSQIALYHRISLERPILARMDLYFKLEQMGVLKLPKISLYYNFENKLSSFAIYYKGQL